MMRRSSVESPYLKPGRLADVMAAVQVLGAHQNSEATIEYWVNVLSRDTSTASIERWTAVFQEHPEFFLLYHYKGEKAALRLRYTNKNVDPNTGVDYSIQERQKLSDEERGKLRSHPLSTDQLEMLLSAAIDLHDRAVQELNTRRWWVTPLVSLVAALIGIGGTIGGVWISQKGKDSVQTCPQVCATPSSASTAPPTGAP